MRAIVFHETGGPGVLVENELARPEPQRREVRVAVRAVALNHLDVFVRRGIPSLKLRMPHIGGSDVSGVVDLVGVGVDEWSVGDEVIVNPSLPCGRCPSCAIERGPLCRDYRIMGEHTSGGLAEFVVVPADRLHAKPQALDFEQAAALPLAFQTAWRVVVTRAAVRPGEDVLVLGGSGGVATAVIQIAHLAGARVIAVTSSPERCQLMIELGAEVAIDRTSEPWSKAAWLATGRRGADVVVENVGEATWADSLRSAAPGGRVVTYGATTGHLPATDLRYVFWRQLAILGSTMATDAEFAAVMRQVERGRLRPVIGDVLPATEARRAHEMLEAGLVTGKLVLRWDLATHAS